MQKISIKKVYTVLTAMLFATAFVACGGRGNGVNPVIDGMTGPDVEITDGSFILSLAIHDVSIDGGLTLPIPDYPNSTLYVGPDFQSNGLLMVVTVAIKDFVEVGFDGLDPQKLPGGRSLPGVRSGSMPAIALRVPQVLDSTFYVGPDALGLFIPVDHGIEGVIATVNFHDKLGEKVGQISLVGSDEEGENAGVFVNIAIDLRIEAEMNRQLAALN